MDRIESFDYTAHQTHLSAGPVSRGRIVCDRSRLLVTRVGRGGLSDLSLRAAQEQHYYAQVHDGEELCHPCFDAERGWRGHRVFAVVNR